MKIDLLALAQKVAETYKDVELSVGTVRVYHTPEPHIWTYHPDRPEPEQPIVKMKLATGQTQSRLMKESDPGYQEWLKDKEAYENDLADIRMAARYVLALRDIEYPDTSKPPPILAKLANGHWPDNELLRKKIWLDHSIFASAQNITKIHDAMKELAGGVSDQEVDEVKKSSEFASEDGQLVPVPAVADS